MFRKIGAAVGDVGMLVGVALVLPVMMLVIGAPIVLVVRVIIELAERF